MKTVSFEPHSLILAAEDVLYVLTRRGISTIQAKNIDRVHDRLKGYLNGKHDRESLLESVPATQRSTLEKYLTKLQETGALRSVDEDGDKPVFVSLDGSEPSPQEGHDAYLFFITPAAARSILLNLEPWKKHAKRIVCVVASDTVGVDCRKQYAKWLLLNFTAFHEQQFCFQLYQFDEAQEQLTKLLEIKDTKDVDLHSIPRQLNVVTVADVDQLPLVVAEAAHPFFTHKLSMVGLSYDDTYEQLINEFCARELLDGDLEKQPLAHSRLHVRFGLLELYAERQTTPDEVTYESVDLLHEKSSHEDVNYLQDVLCLRISSLPARLSTTKTNLFCYESNGRRAASFIREKALRDVLLFLTWDTHYPDVAAQINNFATCDYQRFLNDPALREIADECETNLFAKYGAVQFVYRSASCWGKTTWIGGINVHD